MTKTILEQLMYSSGSEELCLCANHEIMPPKKTNVAPALVDHKGATFASQSHTV